MRNTITKTLVYTFSNRFTKQIELIFSVPYIPYDATFGHYSSLYKRLKQAAAYKFETSLIVGKKHFVAGKSKTASIQLASGAGLNFPYDVTEKDVKIIKHHLEGIKMAIDD